MPVTEIDGASWRYRHSGSGEFIVLIHGLASDSATWGGFAQALATKYSVVSVDLPGFAISDRSEQVPSIGQLALGVDQLLHELGADSYVAVGHSFGGAVALHLAYLFPHQTRALVLIAPGGFGPEINPVVSLLGTPVGHRLLALAYRPSVSRAVARIANRYGHSESRPRRIEELMATYTRLADPTARLRLRRSVRAAVAADTPDARSLTPMISPAIPTLIIWGTEDRVLPPWQLDRASALLPHARLRRIDGAGHTPQRSHPEQTLAAVEAFLAY